MADTQFKVGDFVITPEGATVQVTFVKEHNGLVCVFLANGQMRRPEQLEKSS
jgi:hypothetical protein